MRDPKHSLLAILVIALTLLAYSPVFQAGYIWDDDDYVTENMTLRSLDGLRRIWLEPTSIPQYYPMVHTTFWVEYQSWGLNPFGYHLVNILLHVANVLLLFTVLVRLKVPGAWLAAFVFALHPAHVESVAWITERKNVLSALFFFLSILAYLKYRPLENAQKKDTDQGYKGFYILSLVLFLAALLSKSVTTSLPAVLLLLIWWKKGKVTRRDLIPLVPMFVLGMALSAVTVWMERYNVGATGIEWELSLAERCLIAGRALWFYAGKLVWPYPLIFNYPRWDIDAGAFTAYLYPTAALTVYAVLWLARGRIGRGPLVAVLLFSGVLFPALGFIDVYPMRYSFVADHFQYLASIGLITPTASLVTRYAAGQGYRPRKFLAASIVVSLAMLGVLTFRQAGVYANAETLWLDTVRKNPFSWMAYYHLGSIRADQGRLTEAEAYYRAVIEKTAPPNRHHHMAMNNLGIILTRQGKTGEAETVYRRALEIAPDFVTAMNNLGNLLTDSGLCEQGLSLLNRAKKISPDEPHVDNNRGSALACLGRYEEAIQAFQTALKVNPDDVPAHFNLANAYGQQGLYQQAEEHLDAVARIGVAEPQRILSIAETYMRLRKPEKAVFFYRQLLKLSPDDGTVMATLAWILATSPEERVRNGKEALRFARAAEDRLGKTPSVLDVLAAAYAEESLFEMAVQTAEEALKLGTKLAPGTADVQGIRERLELYRRGKPFRVAYGPA